MEQAEETIEVIAYPQNLRNAINHILYDKVRAHQVEQIDSLIKRHVALVGKPVAASFWYQNKRYGENYFTNEVTTHLHEDLHDEMDELLVERKYVDEQESPYFQALFSDVLYKGVPLYIFKEVMPKSVLNQIPLERQTGLQVKAFPEDPEKVNKLKIKHAKAIELLDKRMFMNLVL